MRRYTTSALSTTQTGCLASTPSSVIWNYSTGTSGTSHPPHDSRDRRASGQA